MHAFRLLIQLAALLILLFATTAFADCPYPEDCGGGGISNPVTEEITLTDYGLEWLVPWGSEYICSGGARDGLPCDENNAGGPQCGAGTCILDPSPTEEEIHIDINEGAFGYYDPIFQICSNPGTIGCGSLDGQNPNLHQWTWTVEGDFSSWDASLPSSLARDVGVEKHFTVAPQGGAGGFRFETSFRNARTHAGPQIGESSLPANLDSMGIAGSYVQKAGIDSLGRDAYVYHTGSSSLVRPGMAVGADTSVPSATLNVRGSDFHPEPGLSPATAPYDTFSGTFLIGESVSFTNGANGVLVGRPTASSGTVTFWAESLTAGRSKLPASGNTMTGDISGATLNLTGTPTLGAPLIKGGDFTWDTTRELNNAVVGLSTSLFRSPGIPNGYCSSSSTAASEGDKCTVDADCNTDRATTPANVCVHSGGVCVATATGNLSATTIPCATVTDPETQQECAAGEVCVAPQAYYPFESGAAYAFQVNWNASDAGDSGTYHSYGYCPTNPGTICSGNDSDSNGFDDACEAAGANETCTIPNIGQWTNDARGIDLNINLDTDSTFQNAYDDISVGSATPTDETTIANLYGMHLGFDPTGHDQKVNNFYMMFFDDPDTALGTGSSLTTYSAMHFEDTSNYGAVNTLMDIQQQSAAASSVKGNILWRGFNHNNGHLIFGANSPTQSEIDHFWYDQTNDVFRLKVDAGGGGVSSETDGIQLLMGSPETGDPCGSKPEGYVFYNDTSNYYCYCDGTNDVQMHSPATACF